MVPRCQVRPLATNGQGATVEQCSLPRPSWNTPWKQGQKCTGRLYSSGTVVQCAWYWPLNSQNASMIMTQPSSISAPNRRLKFRGRSNCCVVILFTYSSSRRLLRPGSSSLMVQSRYLVGSIQYILLSTSSGVLQVPCMVGLVVKPLSLLVFPH